MPYYLLLRKEFAYKEWPKNKHNNKSINNMNDVRFFHIALSTYETRDYEPSEKISDNKVKR